MRPKAKKKGSAVEKGKWEKEQRPQTQGLHGEEPQRTRIAGKQRFYNEEKQSNFLFNDGMNGGNKIK